MLVFTFPLIATLVYLYFKQVGIPTNRILATLHATLANRDASGMRGCSVIVGLQLPHVLATVVINTNLTYTNGTCRSLFSGPLTAPSVLNMADNAYINTVLTVVLSYDVLRARLVTLIFNLVSIYFALGVTNGDSKHSVICLILTNAVTSSLFGTLNSLLGCATSPRGGLPRVAC